MIKLTQLLNELGINNPNRASLAQLERWQAEIEATDNLKTKQHLALKCAEGVLWIWHKYYPNGQRPQNAINAIKTYLKNPSEENKQKLKDAADDAYDAASDAYYAYAADAYYAAWAAYYAAWAASDAVWAAAYAAYYAINALKKEQQTQLNELNITKQIRLNELTINNFSEPTKENFIRYIKGYYHIMNKLQPLIWQRYKDKNFDGLADIIIKKLSKLGKANEEFMDWFNFRIWLNNINKEDLPYNSSGSFATILFDTDFIYNNGENYGLTEKEAEELALNSTRF